MMFRKKPVVVQATQYPCEHPALTTCDCAKFDAAHCTNCGSHIIKTLEGEMRVTHGDWIITGVNGEHYPCKPDIFAATYEPAVTSFETRLKEEHRELKVKTESLWVYANAGFPLANEDQKRILEKQLKAMTEYLNVLGERLVNLGLAS